MLFEMLPLIDNIMHNTLITLRLFYFTIIHYKLFKYCIKIYKSCPNIINNKKTKIYVFKLT